MFLACGNDACQRKCPKRFVRFLDPVLEEPRSGICVGCVEEEDCAEGPESEVGRRMGAEEFESSMCFTLNSLRCLCHRIQLAGKRKTFALAPFWTVRRRLPCGSSARGATPPAAKNFGRVTEGVGEFTSERGGELGRRQGHLSGPVAFIPACGSSCGETARVPAAV